MNELNHQDPLDPEDQVLDLIDAITSSTMADSQFSANHLKNLLLSSEIETLNEVIESVYAIDIAHALESFQAEEILEFYKKIDHEHMAQILEQGTTAFQRNIIKIFPKETILELFQYMSNDDIADILGNLPTNICKELLNLMRSADNIQLAKLLQYEDDTAGGIMTTEYISLRETLKATDALIKIKEIGPNTEIIETIFVINDKKQLVGTADLRDIFKASNDETLQHLMDDNIVTVTPEIDQEEVSQLVSKYDLKAIPVINRKGSLLGIITVDDIIDVLVEEQTEDMLKFGGISGEEGISSSVLQSVKVRLPWLVVNLFTASFAAFIISQFEETIAQVVALSAIMPIVAATSGNSGSQTLAIVIRGITLGELNLSDDWKRVFKEIRVGMLNSFVTGSSAALFVFFMYDNIYLSLIIFAAMLCNSIISSSCGFFIPLTLKKLNLDPALASSIFLTAATDIMAYLIFLCLASVFLPYLI